eukprot:94141-Pelagomonas_calceolata.AAC.5
MCPWSGSLKYLPCLLGGSWLGEVRSWIARGGLQSLITNINDSSDGQFALSELAARFQAACTHLLGRAGGSFKPPSKKPGPKPDRREPRATSATCVKNMHAQTSEEN